MTKSIKQSLGRQLKQAREAKGYTQQEAAGLLGLSRGGLSKFENGHQEPRVEVLLAAAEELDCEFTVDGYRLTKDRLKRPKGAALPPQQQLTFTFPRGQASRHTNLRVTTLRRKIVVEAWIGGAVSRRGRTT